jgi:DNA repair protein RadA/Sms
MVQGETGTSPVSTGCLEYMKGNGMAKKKTVFHCSNCGHETGKWLGKCPSCNEFNTFTEETIEPERSKKGAEYRRFEETKLGALVDVKTDEEEDRKSVV